MTRCVRQFLVLVLAALLAAGFSLSAVHAGDTPGAATTSMDGGALSGGCHKCPMTGDEHTKAFLCGALCEMAAQTVAPQVGPVVLTQARLIFGVIEQSLRGRTSPPDPYPPRPFRAV